MAEAATITIVVPSALRAFSGAPAEISLAAADLRSLLAELERSHHAFYASVCDETGTVRRHVNVFVNTSHMRDREGLDTPLASGDVVTFLPAVSGG
jgi:molybdopterin synthase sulfur carrier subunit